MQLLIIHGAVELKKTPRPLIYLAWTWNNGMVEFWNVDHIKYYLFIKSYVNMNFIITQLPVFQSNFIKKLKCYLMSSFVFFESSI
jgi:hypothetical protein